MGNYVTVAEVRAFKVAGEPVDLSAYTDPEIEDQIEFAEGVVESITGDIFYKLEDHTNRFNGNKLIRLLFPPDVTYPLLSVDLCQDVDTDGQVIETFVEGEDFVPYDYYLEVVLAYPGDRPRRGVFRGGTWPRGQKNIVVTGDWGREETPPEIKRATMLLTIEGLVPGSLAALGLAPTDARQIIWNDFQVIFQGDPQTGAQTGFEAIDRLLARHINFAALVQAVPDEKQTYDNNTGPY